MGYRCIQIFYLPRQARTQIFPVHPRDEIHTDSLRTYSLALPVHGAVTEALCIHGRDHFKNPLASFGLTLRE